MKLHERLSNLTPEQRALFEQRLKEKGLAERVLPQEPTLIPDAVLKHAAGPGKSPRAAERPRRTDKGMEFSLFFFSGDGSAAGEGKYDLLLDSARYADQNGFRAIWTPERHFEDFGGLYPNPSVVSAALAVTTERMQIRAGSVALPLHHPIRFVEEWSVVDNLSRGRVAVSFATGWHPADFVLAPERTREYYDNRKDNMIENIKLIRRLWSGEPHTITDFEGTEHVVKILPRPLQPELEIWVAISNNVETFIKAGEVGAHVLTGMVNQPPDDLEQKIQLYRKARAENGYDPDTGKVTVMLHTCVGESNDEIKELVREPLKDYLKTFIKQQKNIMEGYGHFSEADQDTVVSYAFDKYFEESALFGTPDKCGQLVRDLIDVGVDEVACLVDFGITNENVLDSLQHLTVLKDRFHGRS